MKRKWENTWVTKINQREQGQMRRTIVERQTKMTKCELRRGKQVKRKKIVAGEKRLGQGCKNL